VSYRPSSASTIKARLLGRGAKRSLPPRLPHSRGDRGKGTLSRRHSARFDSLNTLKADGQKAFRSGPGPEVNSIEGRIQALSADDLLLRYHELVDRRLAGEIRLTELFELDRIESRLNARDEDELGQLADFRKEWRRERSELVTNIEELLARLKGAV
jgi:hypothetical protein